VSVPVQGLFGDILQQIAEPVTLLEGVAGQDPQYQLPSWISLEITNRRKLCRNTHAGFRTDSVVSAKPIDSITWPLTQKK
jgi:hypothetical protein